MWSQEISAFTWKQNGDIPNNLDGVSHVEKKQPVKCVQVLSHLEQRSLLRLKRDATQLLCCLKKIWKIRNVVISSYYPPLFPYTFPFDLNGFLV